jgi:hypothetical protein
VVRSAARGAQRGRAARGDIHGGGGRLQPDRQGRKGACTGTVVLVLTKQPVHGVRGDRSFPPLRGQQAEAASAVAAAVAVCVAGAVAGRPLICYYSYGL